MEMDRNTKKVLQYMEDMEKKVKAETEIYMDRKKIVKILP